ncbi:MAG: T9SS type A sorting domain-containing protein [Bacteroidota bacterium]
MRNKSTKHLLQLSISSSFILMAVFLTATIQVNAQAYSLRNNLVVLDIQGDTLTAAWAGGLNAPRLSGMDLNADGFEDVVQFDFVDRTFRTYINNGITDSVSYTYAPSFNKSFQNCTECEEWALAADFNCDGKKDIFCGSNTEFAVYEQVEVNGGPEFRLVTNQLRCLYSLGGDLPMYVDKTDLPAIVDIDQDGDVDIFAFGISSPYLGWLRNRAVEDYGRCDTLVFEEETFCWGHFKEDAVDGTIIMHDTVECALGNFTPPTRKNNGGGSHVGSTTTMLDLNDDGVLEALISDVDQPNISALINVGRSDYAYIDSVDPAYPSSDISVNLSIFPAAFHLDANNDGNRDLIIAPNATGPINDIQGILFYENEDKDTRPDFKFKDHFLQEITIDVGRSSAPVLGDIDNDGLIDLLVGYDRYSEAIAEPEGGLAYFRNIGSSDRPVFQLVNDNYLGLRAGNLFGIESPRPVLGDIDGDGDKDLLIGVADGTLFYFRNLAPTGSAANFQYVPGNFQNIDVGRSAAPALFDIEGDGDLDLFIGNNSGRIEYFNNISSGGSVNFLAVSDQFGGIQITDQFGGTFSSIFASPSFADINDDGITELVVGAGKGGIAIFPDPARGLQNNLVSSGNLLDEKFSTRTSITTASMDSTGFLTMLIGTELGGLQLINALPSSRPDLILSNDQINAPLSVDVQAFPNPANDQLTLRWESQQEGFEQAKVSLFDLQGRSLTTFQTRNKEISISLSEFSPGLYFIQITGNGWKVSRKIIIERR